MPAVSFERLPSPSCAPPGERSSATSASRATVVLTAWRWSNVVHLRLREAITFTQPLSGAYYWCPALKNGKLDLAPQGILPDE